VRVAQIVAASPSRGAAAAETETDDA
jgi:hypothetical protein